VAGIIVQGYDVSGRRGDPSFIVFTRYILLAVEARNELDPRTLGALFLAMCDDMTDIRYADAIALLLQLLAQAIAPPFPNDFDRGTRDGGFPLVE